MDLLGGVMVLMLLLALIRIVSTTTAQVLLMVPFALVGVSLFYLPCFAEQLRVLVRRYGWESFDIVRIEERRRKHRMQQDDSEPSKAAADAREWRSDPSV